MVSNISIVDSRFNDISDAVLENYSSFNYSDISGVNRGDAFPESIYLCNLIEADGPNQTVLDIARQFRYDIIDQYNLLCTLFVYYPSNNGHINWHTNENFDYYNAICTYSQAGNSFFEYRDGEETIRVNDDIGWSVKKTKWSKTNVVPHRAISNDNRITITFSSSVESEIDEFIENITTP
jgi:hypothetical protein